MLELEILTNWNLLRKLSKTVIAIDGIVQQPIAFTPINHKLDFNGHHLTVGIPTGISTFNISGIASVQSRDLIRIDDEYMKVVEVGLSTNVEDRFLDLSMELLQQALQQHSQLVSVERGSVGSSVTSHTDGQKQESTEDQLILSRIRFTSLNHQKVILEQEEMKAIFHM